MNIKHHNSHQCLLIQIISDTRFPPIDTLIRISSELHLTVEYLLDLPRGGEIIDVSDLEPNEVAMIRMMVYMFKANRNKQDK